MEIKVQTPCDIVNELQVQLMTALSPTEPRGHRTGMSQTPGRKRSRFSYMRA
jgi:hypothetical protein